MLVVAVVIGFLFVRSRHKTDPRTAALRVASYCEASRQFDALATSTGALSASGGFDGPPEAMAALVQQAATVLPDLKSKAPSKVRSDVGTVVSAVENAAKGDRAAVTSPKFKEARTRLGVFQGQSCPLGSGDGEG